MHKLYFPKCKVDGPIEPPVPYGHLVTRGAVPFKCGSCKHLFEGGCTRYIEQVNRYMHLDHGRCKVDGPTDPVFYENTYIHSKVEIPRKCASCSCLENDSIHGFYCTQDKDKWGDLHRGLDWGGWEPDSIYIELPLPKVTTRDLSVFAKEDNQLAFIKEYRKVNPGLSLAEAKSDFKYLRDIIVGES